VQYKGGGGGEGEGKEKRKGEGGGEGGLEVRVNLGSIFKAQ